MQEPSPDTPGITAHAELRGEERDAVDALRAMMLAGQEFRQAIADGLSLNITDTFAMSYLSARGALPAHELARALNLATSSTTSLIDRLETNGLATRTRDVDDRRLVVVALTDRGRHELRRVQERMLVALGAVGPADLPAITKVLGGLADNLRAQVVEIRAVGSAD